MPDTLTVTVNNKEMDVPNTISTLGEFLEETEFGGREYELYRKDGGENVKITGGMFVFDDGDEFVAVPKYVGGA